MQVPAEQAQYANEVFNSSYNLGFLGVTSPILELELEDRLVKAITRFLMELGNGLRFLAIIMFCIFLWVQRYCNFMRNARVVPNYLRVKVKRRLKVKK